MYIVPIGVLPYFLFKDNKNGDLPSSNNKIFLKINKNLYTYAKPFAALPDCSLMQNIFI